MEIGFSVLIALLVQSGGIMWWAATLQASLKRAQSDIALINTTRGPLIERYLQTENNVEHMTAAIEKIVGRLELLEQAQKGVR